MSPEINAALAHLIEAFANVVQYGLLPALAGGGVHWANLRTIKAVTDTNANAPAPPSKVDETKPAA